MTLKELQPVLCGRVTLYEEKKGSEGRFHFEDLYSGMSQEIPESLLRREVWIVSSGEGPSKGTTTDIELRKEALT